ncbi:MAG: Di-heme cytochrome peroxidase [Flaviaesturariibacter sp.]|nr:Di-heme cytochrome peroxidase [Flaviaesturariibacter sp.]
MRQKQLAILIGLTTTITGFQFCSKKSSSADTDVVAISVLNLPSTPYNYNVSFPQHIAQALQQTDNTPANNAITDAGATLGRVLFYDKSLSINNTVACASCHKQESGFTDAAVKSLGFVGGQTARHSMNTLNVRFYASGKMFWDERAATLENQVLQPIQNDVEMGMTLPALVTKLSAKSYYPDLFKSAFGTTEVTTDRISKALAQFVRSIVTYQAKYDRVKQGQESFTAQEAQGEQLFLTAGGPGAACGGCHRPPMFTTSNPAGPFALQDPADHGINNQNRFKSGSLRNIAAAVSLFHNGSVPNVTAMLASNIPTHGVPPPNRAPLLAFLQTLTDASVTTDVKFSDPFR